MKKLQTVLQVLMGKFPRYFTMKKKDQDFRSSIVQAMNKSLHFKQPKSYFWLFINLQTMNKHIQLLQRKNILFHQGALKHYNTWMNRKVLMSTKNNKLLKINSNLWAYLKFVKKESFLKIFLIFNLERIFKTIQKTQDSVLLHNIEHKTF